MPVNSLKDLWRSRSRYSSSIIAATISLSTTTFSLMLGESIGVRIDINTLTMASIGFRGIFSTFILITIAFSVVLSLITFTSLTATVMSNRAKDIAILKTSGGSIHKIYSHFMTQVIQLSFVIGGLSILVGMMAYGVSFLILNFILGYALQFSIPALQLAAVFIITITFSVIFSHRSVARTVRLPVTETLSPQIHDVELFKSQGWFEKKFTKPGSPSRTAFRNVRRTRSFALRLATCIFLSMIITTSIAVGGVAGDQTTVSYVHRAIGEDFIFVGHQEMWVQYSSLIGFQTSAEYDPNFNYQRPEYRINSSIIAEIESLPGVTGVDPRLTNETILQEVKITVPVEGGGYTIIGDDRSAKILVTGVQPEKVISNWYISGRFINSSDYPGTPPAYSSAVMGDSLLTIFEDTAVQRARILGQEFAIVGVALDPVDSGWTVYTLYNALNFILGYNGYNMALVKCASDNYGNTLSSIQNNVTKYGLSAFSMKDTIVSLTNFIHSTWLLALTPALFLILTLVLSVISYMNLTFETGRRDFGIMRGIGASPKRLRKTIMMQGLIVSTWPGIGGIVAGLIISLWFFFPEAATSLTSIFVSTTVLLVLLFSACILASAFISSRISRKSTMDIIR